MEDLKPHDALVDKGKRFLKSMGCGVIFGDPWNCPAVDETPDVIGWYDGNSFLIECKASRADFLADAKKSFRANPNLGMGDWRFYMCPEGVIQPEELPQHWGLIWIKNDRVVKKFNWPSNCNYYNGPFKRIKSEIDERRYLIYVAKKQAEQLSELQRESEWVSLEEVLKSDCERVLAFTDNEDLTVRYRLLPKDQLSRVASDAIRFKPITPPKEG